MDKPFRVGDFIEVNDVSGTVINIGIKTTRLRTIQGEEVVLANKNVINENLHNYGKIQERNVRTTIGVTYDTSRENLGRIPSLLKQAVENVEHATFARAHFVNFGASSLDFEFMYAIDNKDYNLFLDVQQEINLHIVDLFAEHKIDIAFPTQTVYVHGNSVKE